MLNTINRAELTALLIAVRHCRPGVKESIATDSKCSLQKIGMHLRSPSSTVDDCHRSLFEAIGHEIMQRAQAGDETVLLKLKSHIGIHGNEMADKLASEAADECSMSRQFIYDLSNDYTHPFKDKLRYHSNPDSRRASRNQSIHKRFAGFTAILLQFSFANWIINYPIVSPFATNWHIGEL